jgi:hypothetical protein
MNIKPSEFNDPSDEHLTRHSSLLIFASRTGGGLFWIPAEAMSEEAAYHHPRRDKLIVPVVGQGRAPGG